MQRMIIALFVLYLDWLTFDAGHFYWTFNLLWNSPLCKWYSWNRHKEANVTQVILSWSGSIGLQNCPFLNQLYTLMEMMGHIRSHVSADLVVSELNLKKKKKGKNASTSGSQWISHTPAGIFDVKIFLRFSTLFVTSNQCWNFKFDVELKSIFGHFLYGVEKALESTSKFRLANWDMS